MNLGELFRSEVVTVSPGDSIATAMGHMDDENVGTVVVVRDRAVVGILTDRDVAIALACNDATPTTPVNDIMARDVLTIWEDQGLFNATQYMQGHHVRRLPIINRDNELVGMVTFRRRSSALGSRTAQPQRSDLADIERESNRLNFCALLLAASDVAVHRNLPMTETSPFQRLN